jgi:hypothetical protein
LHWREARGNPEAIRVEVTRPSRGAAASHALSPSKGNALSWPGCRYRIEVQRPTWARSAISTRAVAHQQIIEPLFALAVVVGSFLAGALGALVGLGDGIIVTPMLVLGFGVDIRYGMGAALVAVIATSSGAGAAYLRDGISNMRIGLFLSVATTSGAVCGAWLATVIDAAMLPVIFGAALLTPVAPSLRKQGGVADAAPRSDPLAVKLHLPERGRRPRVRSPTPWRAYFRGSA